MSNQQEYFNTFDVSSNIVQPSQYGSVRIPSLEHAWCIACMQQTQLPIFSSRIGLTQMQHLITGKSLWTVQCCTACDVNFSRRDSFFAGSASWSLVSFLARRLPERVVASRSCMPPCMYLIIFIDGGRKRCDRLLCVRNGNVNTHRYAAAYRSICAMAT